MDLLQIHHLQAVQNEEEYIAYCRGLNKPLLEENIRALAKGCNYVPGMFANYVYGLAS